VRKGQDYLLDVDGEPFSYEGKDEPKYGGIGTIFDWKGGDSFTLIVELGTNLPGPKIYVKATTDNGYNAGNLAALASATSRRTGNARPARCWPSPSPGKLEI
jgi:hypothetical protein